MTIYSNMFNITERVIRRSLTREAVSKWKLRREFVERSLTVMRGAACRVSMQASSL